jgi:hypothetical protein
VGDPTDAGFYAQQQKKKKEKKKKKEQVGHKSLGQV